MISKVVLVTGGAGYIGSHACKALAQSGYTPVTYDSLWRGNSWAVKWGPLEVGELGDVERLRSVIRKYSPAGVIHFAAFAYVGESIQDPLLYYRNNVSGTISLLKAMQAEDLNRIVFSSSCATYGIPNTTPIHEDMPQLPINPYGQSKLMAEQIIRDLAERCEMSALVLRYFNAAGADPGGEIGEHHYPETHLIPLMLKAAKSQSEPLTIFGDDYLTPDGTCIRDYIHVTDLAEAHVKAFEHLENAAGFSALNLGTGHGYSVKELITATQEVTGREVPHFFGRRREGDPPILVAEANLARRTLDWVPNNSDLRIILETAWKWSESLELGFPSRTP